MRQQFSFDFDTPVIEDMAYSNRYDSSCPHTQLNFYGIFQENSYIRAHVGPVAKKVYAYKTSDMIDMILSREFKRKDAGQEGVVGVTGYGPIVPIEECTFVRPISWTSTKWWEWFSIADDLAKRGKTAVKVISELLRQGRFPLFVIPQEVTDIKMDIDGTDIIISGKWHVQVKCDWKAGPKNITGCTGNLFIQTHERNPKKIY